MAIKELLKEELGNSLRMERDYCRELAKLPRGSLVRKIVRGRSYYYVAVREADRVRFRYLRKPEESKLEVYRAAKKSRAQYRALLADVRRQIRFISRALNAKQAV